MRCSFRQLLLHKLSSSHPQNSQWLVVSLQTFSTPTNHRSSLSNLWSQSSWSPVTYLPQAEVLQLHFLRPSSQIILVQSSRLSNMNVNRSLWVHMVEVDKMCPSRHRLDFIHRLGPCSCKLLYSSSNKCLITITWSKLTFNRQEWLLLTKRKISARDSSCLRREVV